MRVPDMIGSLLVALILTEAISEILTNSLIFQPIRDRLLGRDKAHPRWLGKLFSCGYCMSVWVGIAMAFMFKITGVFPHLGWFEPVLWGLVLHRAANVGHAVIDGFIKGILYAVIKLMK